MLYKPFFVVFLKFGHCVLCIYCFDLDVGAVFFLFSRSWSVAVRAAGATC